MSTATFLDGKVTLLSGDCLERLREIPDGSLDSCCTDPPYHLTSIVKRFGEPDAAPAKEGATGAFARASRGFMGQQWDGGDIAFRAELWTEVLRVLKPGGHVVAFSGTRTYHRMACAIEDAGFDIRDQLAWVYGSGFPKSLDISKAIDKRPGVARHAEFAADLRAAMKAKGYTNTFDVAEKITGRRTGAVANWQKYQFPEARWWPALRDLLDLDEKWGEVLAEAEREKIGERKSGDPVAWFGQSPRSDGIVDISNAFTDAAKQWEGWGTALKPAWEPICLARKPLIGTNVENVLAHGTGALNIDGCRVGTEGATKRSHQAAYAQTEDGREDRSQHWARTGHAVEELAMGRWPANIVHDGSDEVVSVFPEGSSGGRSIDAGTPGTGAWRANEGRSGSVIRTSDYARSGDCGSAARFFYSAKADADDRLGSGHPTVKPVDLMRWLVRLVTPPGGTTLDLFAGTGTTGEAAFREGMNAVLIERDETYRADIARRMSLCLAGPMERKVASLKAKTTKVVHEGLFAALAAEADAA